MKLLNKYLAIFFNFPPISSHLHPLQVENCDSNSWLVVGEDDNVKSGLKGLKERKKHSGLNKYINIYSLYLNK